MLNYLLILLISTPLFQTAFAQTTIDVNSTTPCFLNYTAGIDMWRQCGADEDFLTFALLPFEWITGGYFTMILVSIIILMVYIKYHNPIYPVAIGIIFLPVSFQFFPAQFLTWAVIFIFMALAAGIYFLIKRQTD